MTFAIEQFPAGRLDDLKAITNLQENIDYNCIFIVARDENYQILGVAGINLQRHKYPRFEHIIIHPSKYKSKLAFELMQKIEEYLTKIGKDNYVAYIDNENKLMQKYAQKWGMKEYSENELGKWYFKNLIPEQERLYEYANMG